ncbi:MAG: dTDP-4-dehydrorhamnose reductase [Micromonosporaceae bacterium]
MPDRSHLSSRREGPQRWLVTGAAGLLGVVLCALLRGAGHEVVAVRHRHPVPPGAEEWPLDLTVGFDALGLVRGSGATHVVHAAALTDVDACQHRRPEAQRLHVDVTGQLAGAAAAAGRAFVLVSTDQLWGGGDPRPAVEGRPPAPVNIYGETKAAGERAALRAHPGVLVVRTNFFGASTPWRRSASDGILDVLRGGAGYRGFTDVWFTPIATPILCRLLLAAVADRITGVLHLAGAERISKYAFASRIAAHHGFPADRVRPGTVRGAALAAPRPAEMALDCGRARQLLGTAMPSVAQSMEAVYGAPVGCSASVTSS